MAKAKDAFRTISEVAEWLDTPTHVLRFWESKFTQIKPVKGAGGRRYYRPADMELLGGIKQLLHEDGLTIKGTQKLLREKGAKHVATLGASLTQQATASVPKPSPAAVVETEEASEPTSANAEQEKLQFDTQPPVATDTPSFQINQPALPTALPNVPPRLIGRAPVDTSGLRARAAQIAPLLARLEDLRARMHG